MGLQADERRRKSYEGIDVAAEVEHARPKFITTHCSADDPCCARRNEYNGFGSGALLFKCPIRCPCHD